MRVREEELAKEDVELQCSRIRMVLSIILPLRKRDQGPSASASVNQVLHMGWHHDGDVALVRRLFLTKGC